MFPEVELCETYGVSRTVLREAVKMLTAKGLFGSRPRQGTRVLPESQWNLLDPDVLRWLLERKFSIELLIEFTEVRLAIEPKAAARAARVASSEDKAMIMAAIERMMAAERRGQPFNFRYRIPYCCAEGERKSFLCQFNGTDGSRFAI